MAFAEIAIAEHRPADAVRLAERAARLCEKSGAPATSLAVIRMVWARALVDAGSSEARAVALAVQARDVFRDAGKSASENLAGAEAFLQQHSGAP